MPNTASSTATAVSMITAMLATKTAITTSPIVTLVAISPPVTLQDVNSAIGATGGRFNATRQLNDRDLETIPNVVRCGSSQDR
jgi:hypothetical protein